jgi:LmeA-like phospholipid-binding
MSTGPVSTAPVPVVGADAPVRRKRHRGRWALIVSAVVVLLLVVAVVVANSVFRGYAQSQIDSSVESSLPKGVDATVQSDIHGTWPLFQWLHGSFDHVTLRSTDLTILGGTGSALVEAHGLPVNGGAITDADATLVISQASIRKLAPLASADVGQPTIGNGTITTTVVRKVVSVPITAVVTLKLSVVGKYIHLAPVKAKLESGGVSVNGLALVQALLPTGISVCTATYLPVGTSLTKAVAAPGAVTVYLHAAKLDLAGAQAGKTGHC